MYGSYVEITLNMKLLNSDKFMLFIHLLATTYGAAAQQF